MLQRAPARAAVYGYLGSGHGLGAGAASGSVRVTVSVANVAQGAAALGDARDKYTVNATVDTRAGTWKAFLRPAPAGGSYSIRAACVAGCKGEATLSDVTFGDVWYCAGQVGCARYRTLAGCTT